MGYVRIMPNMIQTLKDTGFQRMNLHKTRNDGHDAGKAGQIVVSLLLLNNIRIGSTTNSNQNQSSNQNNSHNYESIDMNNENDQNPPSLTFLNDNGLPDGWEERKTSTGRVYYVNHNEKTTQWHRPTINQSSHHSSSNNNNSSSSLTNRQPPNENSEPELNNRSNQRRSTRHRHYLARNTLHQAVANLTSETINNNINSSTVHQPNHSRNNLSIDSTSSTVNVNTSLTNINNSGNPMQVVHQRSISNLSNSNLNPHAVVSSTENLPDGYEMRIAPKGQVYFYHVPTDTSTWWVIFCGFYTMCI